MIILILKKMMKDHHVAIWEESITIIGSMGRTKKMRQHFLADAH